MPINMLAGVVAVLGGCLVVMAPRAQPLCQSIPIAVAAEVLGAGARVTKNEPDECEYSATAAAGTRVLSLEVKSPGSSDAARRLHTHIRQQLDGKPEEGLGDAAFLLFESGCSGINVLRGAHFHEVTLCGPGFGTTADVAHLRDLAQRLLAAHR